MTEEIKEYDKNKNCIYYKSTSGFERWCKYDENNNGIHYRNSDGLEFWFEYDENHNIIHTKNTCNNEYWFKYDGNNERIFITHQEFKQIERTKLYLNNKKISRFSLMDI